VLLQGTCVAIAGRAVLIMGPPGSGKSSLALALIDRGAVLVGDDGVTLEERAERLFASPPPNTAGLLEVRNVGLIEYPTVADVPVALALQLAENAPRFIDAATALHLGDCVVPLVALWPDSPVLALRAEAALAKYGIR
jgi:serine kinase of HPr protein (carbohydrate metabolism regulator)